MQTKKPDSELTPGRLVLIVLFLALDELEAETVFEHAGLSPALADDMDAHIPVEEVGRLIASCIELSGDPALGLHLGQELGMEMLDVVGMIVGSSPTFRDALTALSEYMPLLSHLTYFDLHEDGERARMVMHLPAAMERLESSFLGELCAATLFCQARRLVDGNFFLRRLSSRLPVPPWVDEYAQVFGDDVELVFEAGEDSVEFDRFLLDLPMKRHSPGLYQQLRAQAARRMASLPQPGTMAGRVQ
ncbi:MAG: AraC family transcriptional regulator [Moraxellaceae bacterium]